MTNDGHIIPRRPSQNTTIALLFLHIRYNSTLGHRAKRQNIPNRESRVLSSIDELASVHTLVGDESLGVEFKAVRVTKLDFGQGGAAARVVDDVFDDASEVAVAF